MWAQATGGENVFAKLVKAGKKVLRRVLQKQKEIEPATAERIFKPTWSLRAQQVQVGESSSGRLIGGLFPKQILKTHAAEVRRQAALRLIRDAKKVPVFAFVGLTLGASLDQKKHGGDDVLFSGIRVRYHFNSFVLLCVLIGWNKMSSNFQQHIIIIMILFL